ncbi:MAG: hypothetical protein ABFD81_10580 [Syntrophaceae bacterium]
MEKWISKSQSGRQIASAVGCAVVGLALAIGFHDFTGPGPTNSLSGFLLGILLLVIGVLGVVLQGSQTVIVDPATRRISITDKTLFGTKRHIIAFSDIMQVSVGYLGKKSNLANFYSLVLELRNGKKYPLFAPGRFFPGASNRSIVEGWRARLVQYIQPSA